MALEDREKAEEARFKHDQELTFKVRNRRNKLFGLWVATTHLGMSGEAADAYAKDVVMADFERPGDEDVFDKVREDLGAANVEVSDHLLHKHMEECEVEARSQIVKE